MVSLPEAAQSGLLLVPGALLAVAAAVIGWRIQRDALARWLLTLGCLLAVAGLVSVGTRQGWWPSNKPTMAVAAVGAAAGLWSVALYPQDRRVHCLIGLVAGLAMATFVLAPSIAVSNAQAGGLWFGLDEVFYVLASGLLLLGSVCVVLPGHLSSDAHVRWVLALGLLLQSVALGFHAVGAQLAWGAYWGQDPVASWRLAAWLCTAIVAVGVWEMGWSGRRARTAMVVATAVLLLVLLGSLPLVRWLGLGRSHVGG